ncbi:MAG: glycosyl transferase [Patescibacteria group bacterium]|nr:MAG: glycosyl transferase [Patescibacteria group bacterium]
MFLSIILPARNEEFLIRDTLKDITSFLSKRKINDYEILVVLNGCTDGTEGIVRELNKKNSRIKILKSDPGYGLALRKGLEGSRGRYVVVFNVDFYDLKMIDLASIDLYGKDLIIGSKMTHWSADKRPLLRRTISYLFNLYLRLFYGFKGSDTHGIKIMKREVVKKVLPKCVTDSGIFDTEFVLIAQYLGFKFADFPVEIVEKRPPRFSKRMLKTPSDLFNLHRVLIGNDFKNEIK